MMVRNPISPENAFEVRGKLAVISRRPFRVRARIADHLGVGQLYLAVDRFFSAATVVIPRKLYRTGSTVALAFGAGRSTLP
jgi:hypothetical protein